MDVCQFREDVVDKVRDLYRLKPPRPGYLLFNGGSLGLLMKGKKGAYLLLKIPKRRKKTTEHAPP